MGFHSNSGSPQKKASPPSHPKVLGPARRSSHLVVPKHQQRLLRQGGLRSPCQSWARGLFAFPRGSKIDVFRALKQPGTPKHLQGQSPLKSVLKWVVHIGFDPQPPENHPSFSAFWTVPGILDIGKAVEVRGGGCGFWEVTKVDSDGKLF